MYKCLQYLFLFIHGGDRYHYNLQMSPWEGNQLSQTDYVTYQIWYQQGEFSLLLQSNHLFQQYLVDMWVTADQNHLNYLHSYQSNI